MSKKRKTTLELSMQNQAETNYVTISREEYDALNQALTILNIIVSINADHDLRDFTKNDVVNILLSVLVIDDPEEPKEGYKA